MNKSTKIIFAVLGVILIIMVAAFIKLNWFTGFKKPPLIVRDTAVVINVVDTLDADLPDEVLQAEDTRAIYEQQQFPKTGKEIKDFVIDPYEIIMEEHGFLNQDQLEDVILVLQNKNDRTAERPTLVLLKQSDNSYRLYGVSPAAVPPAYIDDYQQFLNESVKIDSAKLKVNLTGYGGITGNRFTTYQFIDGQLILTHLGVFAAGAGGQTIIDIDYLKNKVRIEEVNTMIDEMPSKTTYKNLPPHQPYLFENDEGLSYSGYD